MLSGSGLRIGRGSILDVLTVLHISGIGIVDSLEEGTTCDGRSCNRIHITTILRYGERGDRVLTNDVTLFALLEPLIGLGAQSWGFSVFQECIAQDSASLVKAYQYLEVATEATCSTLYGSAIGLTVVFNSVNDKELFLSLAISLRQGIGFSNDKIVYSHDRLDTVSEGFLFLLCYGFTRDVVDSSENASHDDRNGCEHEGHIEQ